MKQFYLKWGHVVAAFALLVVTHNINVACHFALYQDEIPEKAKKLRKF